MLNKDAKTVTFSNKVDVKSAKVVGDTSNESSFWDGVGLEMNAYQEEMKQQNQSEAQDSVSHEHQMSRGIGSYSRTLRPISEDCCLPIRAIIRDMW